MRELRRLVEQLGADGAWCLERGELLSVARRCVEVCAAGRPLPGLVQHCGYCAPEGAMATALLWPHGTCAAPSAAAADAAAVPGCQPCSKHALAGLDSYLQPDVQAVYSAANSTTCCTASMQRPAGRG